MKDAPCIPLRVECYAGYRADERPEAFWLCRRRIAVRAIVDRWLGEDCAYFEVTGEDAVRYILRRDDRRDRWDLISMVASTLPGMEAHG
jgi:hypothetical protein